MFRGLRAIAAKEFIHVLREPSTIVFALFIPLIQLIIFGYALDTDVKHIPTAVLNQDQRTASRDLIDRFTATQYFDVVDYVGSDQALRDEIVSGRAHVGIKIPPDFSEKVARGTGSQVLVLIDGSDSQVASRAQSAALSLGLQFSSEIVGRTAAPLIDVRPRVLFNPDMRSANFFVPGLVGIIMQIVLMMLTALSIVREKENGTLEQLLVTPVGRFGLMIGKLVPYAVLGLLEIAIVLLFMWTVFAVPIHGSILLLAAVAPVFLFSGLGLGLLISTFAQSQVQAFQASFLIIMPSVLLSGFVFPRESMPALIYPITTIIPVTYFLEILRGIIIRGAGWSELWQQVFILIGLGVVILTIAAARFQKRLG
ncbi:MAG: ABC transporter permease [Armatimonadota bacterium]